MSMNRWKVMAGVLGVSLGGLAAFAGQCPKDETTRNRAADLPVSAEGPKAQAVKPAGSGPAVPPLPVEVPPPAAPSFDLPALPTPMAKPADPPPAPTLPAPTAATPPVLDVPPPPLPILTEPKIATMPEAKPGVLPAIPTTAATTPVIPVSGTAQPTPPTTPSIPPAVAPAVPPAPASTPPAPAPSTTPPPLPSAIATPPASVIPSPPDLVVEQPRPTSTAPPAPAPSATKFRILLRVGEGEPTFEVKHGDDLILKVACEKVDIKSPEKGQGPSEVFATGKVRFVGFGAKGTCEQLSFLAGTGEVKLLGDVKVQVLDKIGRVESELCAEKIQYRLDAGNLPGLIKP